MNLLRLITCGSVDDGKSTLMGRLLHDVGAIPEDQVAELLTDSRRRGRRDADYSLLLDGLAAEREQGITIDVSYRYFSTELRSFIVADTPGHEQYTRNMVTAASRADLALMVLDARKGMLTQTRRHLYLCSLLGVRTAVLAVNKMDLVGYEQAVFDDVAAEFRAAASALGFRNIMAIPVSALIGENITVSSAAMPWFGGPHVLQTLETADCGQQDKLAFRMPVQWVNHRPDFRCYAGLITSGTVQRGAEVRILPGEARTRINSIVTLDGERESACAGQSVTLTFGDAVDCSRGHLIADSADPPDLADQFEASLVWMDKEPLLPGRGYLLKIGAMTVPATVTALKYQVNVETGEHVAAKTLDLNGIAVTNIALDQPIAYEPYARSRDLGGFILVDRISDATVGAGMIHFGLRRSQNIHWQHVSVDREAHAALKGQQPKVVWFTGLSGAGKSTIANLVQKKLHALGRHTYLLDGDNLRHGLNKGLGFSDADRVENIRRAGEVAKLMADAGLIVLCAFISPFRIERRSIRQLLPPGDFIEVHIDVSLPEAERRDPKGLYAKARRGELPNFTGIDSTYEPPETPELHLDTLSLTPEEAADRVVRALLGIGPAG